MVCIFWWKIEKEKAISILKILFWFCSGGKGAGVVLHASPKAFENYVKAGEFDAPSNGTILLQERIVTSPQRITRAEFVGGYVFLFFCFLKKTHFYFIQF